MITPFSDVDKLQNQYSLRKYWQNDFPLRESLKEFIDSKKFPTDLGYFTMIDMTYKFKDKRINYTEPEEYCFKRILTSLRPNTYTPYSHCKYCYLEQTKHRRVSHPGAPTIYKNQRENIIIEDDMCVRCGLPLIEYVGFTDFRDRFCVVCALMNKYHLRPHMRCLLHSSSKSPDRGQTYVIFRNQYSLSSASKSKKKGTWRYNKIKILLSPEVRRLNSIIRLEYLWVVQDLAHRQLFGRRVLNQQHPNAAVIQLLQGTLEKVRKRYGEIGPNMKFHHHKPGSEILFSSSLRKAKKSKVAKSATSEGSSGKEVIQVEEEEEEDAEEPEYKHVEDDSELKEGEKILVSRKNEDRFYECLRKLFRNLERKILGHIEISKITYLLKKIPDHRILLRKTVSDGAKIVDEKGKGLIVPPPPIPGLPSRRFLPNYPHGLVNKIGAGASSTNLPDPTSQLGGGRHLSIGRTQQLQHLMREQRGPAITGAGGTQSMIIPPPGSNQEKRLSQNEAQRTFPALLLSNPNLVLPSQGQVGAKPTNQGASATSTSDHIIGKKRPRPETVHDPLSRDGQIENLLRMQAQIQELVKQKREEKKREMERAKAAQQRQRRAKPPATSVSPPTGAAPPSIPGLPQSFSPFLQNPYLSSQLQNTGGGLNFQIPGAGGFMNRVPSVLYFPMNSGTPAIPSYPSQLPPNMLFNQVQPPFKKYKITPSQLPPYLPPNYNTPPTLPISQTSSTNPPHGHFFINQQFYPPHQNVPNAGLNLMSMQNNGGQRKGGENVTEETEKKLKSINNLF